MPNEVAVMAASIDSRRSRSLFCFDRSLARKWDLLNITFQLSSGLSGNRVNPDCGTLSKKNPCMERAASHAGLRKEKLVD
jgi:hypothetical protein